MKRYLAVLTILLTHACATSGQQDIENSDSNLYPTTLTETARSKPGDAISQLQGWNQIQPWLSERTNRSAIAAKGPNTAIDHREMIRIIHLCIEQELYTKANYLIEELLNQDPKTRSLALNALGVMQSKRKNADQAEKSWLSALDLDATNISARLNLGNLYLRNASFLKGYETLKPIRNLVEAQLGLLVAERNLELFEQIERRCADMLSKHPDHPTVLYNCALFEFQNNRHADKAIILLTKAIKNLPADNKKYAQAQKTLGSWQNWKAKHQPN